MDFLRGNLRVQRIAIFDDHRAVRDMLTTLLARPGRYEVVGGGGTGREAIDVCLKVRPDLVILDLVFPDINGVEVLAELRRQIRGLKVIFFSACLQEQLVARAIALGASGYVAKNEELPQLLSAIDAVSAGGKYFDAAISHLIGRAAKDLNWQALSPREREVLKLIARGNSTKEAATILGISTKTLDKHRSHMMKKLRLHDVVAVTRYAIQAGLVVLD